MVKSGTGNYYIYLNAVSSYDLLLVSLTNQGAVISKQQVKQGVRTEKLLTSFIKFVLKNKGQLKGIVVAQGAGSFTQSRLVCAVANAWAYAHQIKLAKVHHQASLEAIVKKLPKLKWQPLIRPDYRSPAVG